MYYYCRTTLYKCLSKMYQKVIVEMSYYNLTFMGVGNEYTNLSFRSLLGKLGNKPCDIKQMSNQICLSVPHILNVTLLYELQRDKPSDQGCGPSSLMDRPKTFPQGGGGIHLHFRPVWV